MADARRFLKVDGDFELLRGVLAEPVIAYETWGRLNDRADNAILMFTGLSPSAHAASSPKDPSTGWWEDMVGPGKPIDTQRYFVVCINSLGSCFGSTGPASVDPASGETYRLTFPVLSLEDIAHAGQAVVASLGITSIHAVVGSSMGGMTALAFTLIFPGRAKHLISISSAARSLPFSIALRSLQRELICNDPAWKNGEYTRDAPPETGLRMARKLGIISYRSAEEWAKRFGRERATDDITSGESGPFGGGFEVEAYLQAHADKFVGTFDANCYLYLSRAMDLFDASDHGGSIGSALAHTDLVRALIVGVRTDFLFPMIQQKELADSLTAAGVDVDFQILDSLQGHDSFLIDIDRFRPVVDQFLHEADQRTGLGSRPDPE